MNELELVEGASDGAEFVVDVLAQEGQDTDDHDSDQGEDQSILNETLAFFFSKKAAKHCDTSK